MQEIIVSKFAGYKPINMYFFIHIVGGLVNFRRPIFKNSSGRLLLLFSNQIFKSDLFRQTVCVFILVNISNITNTSPCSVAHYKETIQLVCSPYQLTGFYIKASTAK